MYSNHYPNALRLSLQEACIPNSSLNNLKSNPKHLRHISKQVYEQSEIVRLLFNNVYHGLSLRLPRGLNLREMWGILVLEVLGYRMTIPVVKARYLPNVEWRNTEPLDMNASLRSYSKRKRRAIGLPTSIRLCFQSIKSVNSPLTSNDWVPPRKLYDPAKTVHMRSICTEAVVCRSLKI
jgi:hypothetical protein